MNAAVFHHEPYRVQAGILAAIVHGAFFALLYFGFTWQTIPPAFMNVELWQPEDMIFQETVKSPPPPPPPPPKKAVVPDVKPAPPEKVVAPEIAVPDKKTIKPKPVDREAEKRKAARKAAEVKKARQEKIAKDQAAKEQAERERVAREQAAQEQAAREQVARKRAEQEAAIGKVVDEYITKIRSKIRHNIVMPANVADEARAEYSVTLLPGGGVLQAKLLQASGNELYDIAVKRAILKSDPLPLPHDVKLFNRFRNLKLSFKPVE
ncbi:MAG: cell envelope integrity protein TolA [Gallionella sp.]